jgi:hypothetical protein
MALNINMFSASVSYRSDLAPFQGARARARRLTPGKQAGTACLLVSKASRPTGALSERVARVGGSPGLKPG